ncbi:MULTISPECIES: hypothetical protein [Streptomyces]|uniref:hypothetical protein n=1 Tax=Streptomyces TaxID=1883 RepID=UPI00103C9D65|nr:MULTISPECIES: hypothetical protein [Streptomyces]MBT3077858.1 hypothetical protein [Streptomyces sp. COG21]MBT3084700.1 hypothetical protein [Streptomyces sp. COG20]MBT3085575.1 hypothetical protein [Streptomyces sp. CYG21]MBT3100143.1 hypothetical protein [Streptomyces sp. CBG30]MBT3103351.1 hypothetical protein [Streptomyces sp. COG19]
MGRPSRLGDEDRSDYADVLDEVLASAEIRRLLERSGVSGGPLRARALAAAARTAPAAAAEYRAYAAVRRAHHDRVPDGGRPSLSGPGAQERPGAGVLAVLGVLTPILAAVAATTFLLLGYGLRLTDSLADLADTLVRVGWVSLAIAAATALISLVALYRTAALQSAPGAPTGADRPADLDRARDAWRTALRDKAIRPFLLQELAEAADGTGEVPEGRSRPAPPAFTGPDFSAPDFSAPDFTAPDFSGPGAHTRPAYSRPDFTGPGFSGPGSSSA